MRAFKGFNSDLSNRLGSKQIQFEVGKTYEEEASKTVKSGFHCCENPFECLSYYTYLKDVFCEVEAAGSLDEDEAERIACTKLSIKRILTPKQFAFEGLRYIIEHPLREKWEKRSHGVQVAEQDAEAYMEEYIAIARGISPVVSAVKGAYVGLIQEDTPGWIRAAKFVVAPQDGIYSFDEEGRLVISEM